MKAEKILIIAQEVAPYVQESEMAEMCLKLALQAQEKGRQVRMFMPRWAFINERRNQLHEVIRLSGMNLIIDGNDHALIIKVASVGTTRLQVYFIDNDDYFQGRGAKNDGPDAEYADNVERAIFFVRGVLETVKKLRWMPDVIHCHGKIASLAPLFIKTAFHDDPPYTDARVVFSTYGDAPTDAPAANFARALRFRSLDEKAIKKLGVDLTSAESSVDLALKFSDAFIHSADNPASNAVFERAVKMGLPTLSFPDTQLNGEVNPQAYLDFYDTLMPADEA